VCGIAGIVAPAGAPVSSEFVRRMVKTLTPRGPDDVGTYTGEGCGLGHRRLSIVDLAGGHQPMASGSVRAVVNGEIYNFRDLRRQLEREGCAFRTESDSEVVAHGYRIWGDGLPERLEGMYALAAWSEDAQTLLLARDRMGQKPLYWTYKDGVFLFGSELKALLAVPAPHDDAAPWSWDLSREGVATYLTLECLPDDFSIFAGVHKLRPAEKLRFDRPSGRLALETYWRPRFGGVESSVAELSEDAATDRLEQVVLASVERRLMADVPIGVLLSGGVDSSVIAAAMARQRPPGQVKTFSIGFDDRSFDESPHAATVARHLGTDHHVEHLAPKAMSDILPDVADYMDEPLGDASICPTYLLCRFVRKHVKVALGGDGGDELFLGYPTFLAEQVAEWIPQRVGRYVGLGLQQAARLLPVSRDYFSFDFKVKRFARGLGFDPAERHVRWLGSFTPEEASRVLSGHPSPDRIRELVRGLWTRVDAGEARDTFDRLTAQYLALYLAGDVLTKVDRASMAHGLEVRAPFLDRELVELACDIPSRHKLAHGQTKAPLKRLARRWLPASVVDRPKRGFAVPMADWLRGPLRDLGEDLLAPARLARQGLFDPGPVRALWSAHQAGTADHRKPLWTLLAFQLWFDRYGRSHSSMRWAA